MQYFIIAEFTLNKEYIAKNLCTNRDKPELQCGGKCYLNKKLGNASKNDSDRGHSTTFKKQILLLEPANRYIMVLNRFIEYYELMYPELAVLPLRSFKASIFKPPSVC